MVGLKGFLISYIFPIIVILLVSYVKEFVDEVSKRRKDEEFNSQRYTLITPKGEVKVRSDQIKVGDILKLLKEQRAPVDGILLYTIDNSGSTFVQTD